MRSGSLRILLARIRGLFAAKHRLEQELDEEVRFHLEMQMDDNVRAGMNPAEARYAALRSFGGVEGMKETYRDGRALVWAETTLQDVRYSLRSLRKSPGFTIAAVSTLALAIGSNTAVFSVLDSLLLRPLPIRAPEQVMLLWTELPSQQARETRTAYGTVEQWRSQSSSFTDMAVSDPVSLILSIGAESRRVSALRISPNFFDVLGVQPQLGRVFSAREAGQRERLALISYRFWQSQFSGSPAALGASIVIDGRTSSIVGIMPESLDSVMGADVWEPHTAFPDWETKRRAFGAGPWFVHARLKPGVTIEQAQAEMSAVSRHIDEQSGTRSGISVVPLARHIREDKSPTAVWMLAGAVFFVLLIAATNVTSLSLARNAAREPEMALRAALGASRGRIVRQLLVESLTLAALSGLLGILIGVWGVEVVRKVQLPGWNAISVDWHVAGWAVAFCVLTGVLVGVGPALTAGARNLRPSGLEGGRGVLQGALSAGIRRLLVVAEFALAIMLLAGAGLLIRSLYSIEAVDPGFKTERILSVALSALETSSPAQQAILYRNVLSRISSLPGVESASLIGDLFIGGSPERVITTEDGRGQAMSERLRLRSDEISEDFFRTVRTPLLRGRLFSEADTVDAPPVAIINDVMARRLWPGRDAVGQRFQSGVWFTVVGVVGDMRRQGLEREPIPQMFVPMAQSSSRLVTLLVRSKAEDPLQLGGAVRAAVREVNQNAPVYGMITLDAKLDSLLAQRRFQTALLFGFSLVALLMAAIGIYGLIQYSITARTREIGIRMALGAKAGEIFRMVLGDGLRLSVVGAGIGVLGALALGRLGSTLLFGVTPADPVTFVTVPLILIVVAMAACYFPARRAMQVEPTVALRQG